MTVVFLILLAAVLIYEAAALWTRRRGDTISEHAWDLRIAWPVYGGLLLDVLTVWLVFHINLDQLFGRTGANWWDLLLVAVTAAVAYPIEKRFSERRRR